MKLISCASYEELGRVAADLIAAQVQQKPNSVLGLATGSTPISTYQAMIADCKAGKVDFSKAYSVNLDEYCDLAYDHPQSYHYFMEENLFSSVNLPKDHRFLPSPEGDATAACAAYDAKIEELGGVDIQILGIGLNGHIGFNEPQEKIPVGTYVIELTESTRQANSRFFDSMDQVPTHAMTMGLGMILRAKKILLLAEGQAKKEIIERAVHGEVTPLVPASFLQLHPDVTVITHF